METVLEREVKPGFSLVKYGHVLTCNFNQEFALRLNRVLTDHETQDSLAAFSKQLAYTLNAAGGENKHNDQFILAKFQHVFTVVFDKDLAQQLDELLNNLLSQQKVSPALYSFAKQLEGCLYRRFETEGYADEVA